MKNEILAIHSGIDGEESCTIEENNLNIDWKSIMEITRLYSMVILSWEGYACIGHSSENKEDYIFSRDLDRTIDVIRKRFLSLGSNTNVPLIIAPDFRGKMESQYPCTYFNEAKILARRFLSDTIEVKDLNVAIVSKTGRYSQSTGDKLMKINSRYPNTSVSVLKIEDFVRALDGQYDAIYFLGSCMDAYVVPSHLLLDGPEKQKDEEIEVLISYEQEFQDSEFQDMGVLPIQVYVQKHMGVRCSYFGIDIGPSVANVLYRVEHLVYNAQLDMVDFFERSLRI